MSDFDGLGLSSCFDVLPNEAAAGATSDFVETPTAGATSDFIKARDDRSKRGWFSKTTKQEVIQSSATAFFLFAALGILAVADLCLVKPRPHCRHTRRAGPQSNARSSVDQFLSLFIAVSFLKVRVRARARKAGAIRSLPPNFQLQKGFALGGMRFRAIPRSSNCRKPMSASGQKQTLRSFGTMSALPPKADITRTSRHVRFVPKADIMQRSRE